MTCTNFEKAKTCNNGVVFHIKHGRFFGRPSLALDDFCDPAFFSDSTSCCESKLFSPNTFRTSTRRECISPTFGENTDVFFPKYMN